MAERLAVPGTGVVHRAVWPVHVGAVHAGRVSADVFRPRTLDRYPYKDDKGQLSLDDGRKATATDCSRRIPSSTGAVTVAVQAFVDLKIPVYAASSTPNPAHVQADYNAVEMDHDALAVLVSRHQSVTFTPKSKS